MTICMMNDNFYRSSGVAITIRRITEAMPSTNFLFAGCGNEGLLEDLTWISADRYRCFQLKVSNPFLIYAELKRLKLWLQAHGCDLVHCHHRRLASILRIAGIPVLYTGHLVFSYALWFHLLRPRWMTAVTPSVASNLLKNTGKPVECCIGNPYPFPEIPPPYPTNLGASRAVCIARLDPVKGHRYLLDAWKILCDRGHNVHLDIVGEGPLREELELQSQCNNTQASVHFHGFVADVKSLIATSLFATLVSEYEGQGLATLESAALGRPSLLTAVPGSVDLIPPQGKFPNGLTYTDITGLANALEFWFTHPGLTIEEGKIFFLFLRNSCDPKSIAQQYLNVYRHCLDNLQN